MTSKLIALILLLRMLLQLRQKVDFLKIKIIVCVLQEMVDMTMVWE